MTYENTQLGGTSNRYPRSKLSWMGKHYLDKWGDEWERTDSNTVVCIRDGRVGSWFYGEGLEEVITNESL